jgi:hypothetical protein
MLSVAQIETCRYPSEHGQKSHWLICSEIATMTGHEKNSSVCSSQPNAQLESPMNWYAYNFLANERVASLQRSVRPHHNPSRVALARAWLRHLAVRPESDAAFDRGVAARGPGSATGTAAASISQLPAGRSGEAARTPRAA